MLVSAVVVTSAAAAATDETEYIIGAVNGDPDGTWTVRSV